MGYVLVDGNLFLGKDAKGRAMSVMEKENVNVFKSKVAAENFLNHLPDSVKIYNWQVRRLDSIDELELESEREKYLTEGLTEIKKFGNTTKTTTMEDEDFDICGFFTDVINVMSQLDRFITNMISNEQISDMKILDVRHYLRDNDHRLSAIQMQRLGYYLQSLEKERYGYKSKRLIASMFLNNIDALKDKNNIHKMNDILTSKYRPKVLDDTDIEYIINKKKEEIFIA